MNSGSSLKFAVISISIFVLLSLAAGFEGGDGSSESPYEIATCQQLQDMEGDLSAHYVLVDDVDCSDTDEWNGGDGFNPVGTFTGSLDGDYHEIEGLFIDRPNRHVGLFDITDGADIRNLGVVDAEVIGERRVAHIVGNTDGNTLIENVYSEGTVTGLGDGSWAQAGAIVGRMESSSKVKNAYSNTDLEAVDDSAHGSLIGFMRDDSEVEKVYALGEVVDMETASPDRIGGLIGDFYDEQPEVRNAYSSALVDASGSTVGGFLGNDDSSASPSVAESYWDIDTSGQTSSAGDPEGLSTNEMRGDESTGNMDFDFEESWVSIEEDEEIIAQDASNRLQRITPQEDGYPVLNNSNISNQLHYQSIEHEVEPFLDDYEVIAFEETGEHTWEVPEEVDEVDVLVVGGGGAGGFNSGGGGGAGGVVKDNFEVESEEKFSITVGDGGDADQEAESGQDSTIESEFDSVDVTAIGGGRGGSRNPDHEPEDGGSGGGQRQSFSESGGQALQPSSKWGGNGSDGGSGAADTTSNDAGAGGGGAQEEGETPSDFDTPGDGGDGIYIGDKFDEEFGEDGWVAGGGAGGGENTDAEGGQGGGGDPDGTGNKHGQPATGAGGGGGDGDNGVGGDGGSGIVLVRYEFDLDPSICDRRGPIQECVSDSTHPISGQEFTLENIFEAESTSVFEALDEKASITVSNSTTISGLWQGSFDIQSDERTRLEAGAQFQPESGRISIN